MRGGPPFSTPLAEEAATNGQEERGNVEAVHHLGDDGIEFLERPSNDDDVFGGIQLLRKGTASSRRDALSAASK